MSAPHRTDSDLRVPRIAVARLRLSPARALALSLEDLQRQLAETPGDCLLLEWESDDSDRPTAGCDLRGLYRVLGAAARVQRVVFPARWLPVHRPLHDASTEVPDDARLLAIARSDAALQRLFAEAAPALEGRGLARPDEPVVLLGVEGDALSNDAAWSAGSSPTELRRRAEQWIHRLGADRVALVVPPTASDEHPLIALAARRTLPLLAVGFAAEVPWRRSADAAAATPLLWTDFQFDHEHRLPDDTHIPGLRDLLHRGALLRERSLFDRLPEAWRLRVDTELRALYAWHVSPLLRRVAALVQTCDAVAGVQIAAPLPQLRSVTAYLLGLTDQRPHLEVLATEDPVESARRLATALQSFDRRINLRVEELAWPQLHARLATWSMGGHLAACAPPSSETPVEASPISTHHFCFSGHPLGLRAPVQRGLDGIGRVDLHLDDRRVLGWFELRCDVELVAARAAAPATAFVSRGDRARWREPVALTEILGLVDAEPTQLQFGFGEASPYRENIA